jgi:hypothetical protein
MPHKISLTPRLNTGRKGEEDVRKNEFAGKAGNQGANQSRSAPKIQLSTIPNSKKFP